MIPALPGLFRLTTLTVSLLALAGCGMFSSSAPEEKVTLLADRQNVLGDGLTLYEAIALSLQAHLDERTGNSGMLDLSPISSTDLMMQSWATLDRSIDDARKARIDDPQVMIVDSRRKASWSIIQETEMAYRRAALAQKIQSDLQAAILGGHAAVSNPSLSTDEKASILAEIADLETLEDTLSSSLDQLAFLLGVQNPDSLKLELPDSEAMTSIPEAVLGDMENLALLSRPEIQNGKKLGADDVDHLRSAALQTFPGIQNILGSKQGGKHLSPEQWSNFSSGFSKSLTRIFTLPLTIEQPDIQARLDTLRQQALSAAIMAQVHLAAERYETALADMQQYQSVVISADQTVAGTLKTMALQTRTQMAAMTVQSSYNGLLNTLGIDMLPDQTGNMTVASLSATLENQFENTTPDLLNVLVARADDVLPETTTIMAANHSFYQHPDLVPAAFHPVDFAMRLPLAQKIFRQENPSGSIFHHFSSTSRPLKISENGVQNLLDAPITEP